MRRPRSSAPDSASLLLVLVVAGLSACGYEMVRYDASSGARGPAAGVQRVSVETFSNQTNEPGVELIVSEALRREFLRRGALELVNDPEQADLLVSGLVADLQSYSRSLSTVVMALEYELTLVLEVRVQTREGERIALDSAALRASDLYLASADVEAARKNRREVLHRVSGVLARRLHESLDDAVLQ